MPWFDIKTTCDPDAGIPVSDVDIDNAVPFDGWSECYLDWPERLWQAPFAEPFKVPCMGVAENAWHIKQLADHMQRTLQWVGPPLDMDNGIITDGNHRIRACKYLFRRFGVSIPQGSS